MLNQINNNDPTKQNNFSLSPSSSFKESNAYTVFRVAMITAAVAIPLAGIGFLVGGPAGATVALFFGACIGYGIAVIYVCRDEDYQLKSLPQPKLIIN
jgi:uncharacterized oligopeptide transporter (OPT) family protein